MLKEFDFNQGEKFRTIDFPYKIKNLEAIDLTSELLKDKLIVERMDFLKKHHLPSYNHSVRVGTLSADLGFENNFDETETRKIGAGGLLHDLGKCAIPLEILCKDSPLTKEEMTVMRTHAREGFERLKDQAFDGVREIVIAHHEYQIENPYPRNPNKRQNGDQTIKTAEKSVTDIYSAIVAAADIFDALSIQRPYNPKFDLEEIEKIIRQSYSGDQKFIDQILERYKAQE